MNILTFDIEEWAIAKEGGYGTPEKYAEYDAFLDVVLTSLDSMGVKATFFCTGQMAEHFPSVVRKIQSHGHEIGCHSDRHTWMNKMDYKDAADDTRKAIDALELCVGEKIMSYRAPAFSIGESNKWMFEILASNGIACDASIFPSARDLGGFPGFPCHEPCLIEYNGVQIKEFPICMASLFGRDVAYSGGGYFRLFPYWFIKSHIQKGEYSMCYFHIYDLLPDKRAIKSREEYESYFMEPGTLKNRYLRYFKSNIGKINAWNKLERLIKKVHFASIYQFVCAVDVKELPIVQL